MSLPRDLKVDDPRPRHRQDQRAPTRNGGAEADGQDGRAAARHPDQPRRQRQLRRLPRARQPARLRLRRRRPPLLQRQRRPAAVAAATRTIDLKPGYQKLCGQDALDYVRFRHDDSDFVRAARQQEFLRQAKEPDRPRQALRRPQGAAARSSARYTQTDIALQRRAILRLLKLALESAKNAAPARSASRRARRDGRLRRRSRPSGSPGDRRARSSNARRSKGRATRRRPQQGATPKKQPSAAKAAAELAAGLIVDKRGRRGPRRRRPRQASCGCRSTTRRSRLARGGYVRRARQPRAPTRSATATSKPLPRLPDRRSTPARSASTTASRARPGRPPPILDNPTETDACAGASTSCYYDGNRLRLVAWQTREGVYWVSNTLCRRSRTGRCSRSPAR